MISEGGFDVVEAENADKAIAILRKRPDVQVVLTDIRLPGEMDGLKFARYVRRKWPPIKIIATSGHIVVDEGDLPDGGIFLPKPYTFDKITTVIRECTGAN
jgi:CheY-like chemotaxis protein